MLKAMVMMQRDAREGIRALFMFIPRQLGRRGTRDTHSRVGNKDNKLLFCGRQKIRKH